MSADFRGSTLIKFAEMRRLELVEQVDQFRLAELAVTGDFSRDRRRTDLKIAMQMLSDRLRMIRQSRGSTRQMELGPTSETA
jgi:hypothetical protein